MKQKMLKKWEAATKLHFGDSIEKWKSVFPTAKSFESFYEDTKDLAFPEYYGQSPFDDAFSIAYELKHGVTETSKDFYAAYLDKPWMKERAVIMDYYGIEWKK